MDMRKTRVMMVVVALSAILTAVPSPAQDEGGPGWLGYNPAGAWIETSVAVGEAPFLVTMVPIGPGHGRLAIVSEIVGDMGFGAVDHTAYRGVAKRVARNTYDFTQVLYTTDAANEVVVINVASGTAEFIDRSSFIATATVALYGPGQDPFGSEPPMYGSVPISHTFTRIPVVPPVVP